MGEQSTLDVYVFRLAKYQRQKGQREIIKHDNHGGIDFSHYESYNTDKQRVAIFVTEVQVLTKSIRKGHFCKL